MKPESIYMAHFPEKLLAQAANLDQIFQDVPVGFSIVDCDLRYVSVNSLMASINGIPVGEHCGKTLQETNPRVALALEPIFSSVINEDKALVEVETEVSVSTSADTREANYFLTSCYPLKSDEGNVFGAVALVRDISGQKLRNAAQDELLKFESLLSELSAAFINIPVSEVDRKIEQGLQKIVEFMEVDRCSIWQYSADDGRLHRTHSYALPGIKVPPLVVDEEVPVWTGMSLRGEIFRVSDVNKLSDEFWREKKYCRDMGGIKSFIFIPLNVGGTVVGLLSLAAYNVMKSWHDLLIQRLRLLWEIFGNALERKRADQTIQDAVAEIQMLRERLEAENLYLRDQIEIEYKHEGIIGQSSALRRVLL